MAAQDAPPPSSVAVPPDTYGSPAVRSLVARAMVARTRQIEGIESYEGKLRQRLYIGLTSLRFRRERGLFEHERIAHIRWTASGDRVIQWVGLRTAIPIAGLDTGKKDRPDVVIVASDDSTRSISLTGNQELGQEMADELLDEDADDMMGFDFSPGADRLTLGDDDDWALHPLADTAAAHYRYALGDTLRITLPANERNVVLYEVLVEPRRADFHLMAGSIWFDSASASLVRATYRPARPFNLAIDDPGESDDVPGFLQPIEAEIMYITIEYSLQELEYWLPRRYAFEGEARVGSLFRVPITLEWSVGEYLVNETQTDLLVEGDLPEGWQRQENISEDDDGREIRTTVIVPTVEELRLSPDLSEDFGERSPTSFSMDEIENLAAKLDGLLPTYNRFRPSLDWGLSRGMARYNRVEGLSFGGISTIPLNPRFDLEANVRAGSGDRTITVSLGLRWGPESTRWTLSGYHRLQSMSDNGDPFGFVSSTANLFLGTDRGEYYRSSGGSLGYQDIGERVRFRLAAFYERQRAVALESDFSIREWNTPDFIRPVLAADEIDVGGARTDLSWFSGIDPNGLIVTGRLTGELGFGTPVGVTTGDVSYQRATATLSASHPLPFGLAGAIEVGGGTSWGDLPVQRQFFVGGAGTLRGFNLNELWGDTFWRGRAEIATGFAAARIGLFTDIAWAGARDDIAWDDRYQGVGIGTSLLDGLFRFDIARAITRGDRWKVHFYLDGLF